MLVTLVSPLRKTVAINTASQLATRFLTSGSTFIISLLLIRHFGIESYGDFVKITTFVAPFYLLADFGSNAVFLQSLASKSTPKLPSAWLSLLTFRFLLSLILFIGIAVIISVIPRGVTEGYTALVRFGIVLFAPSVFFQAAITSANAVFQKHLRYSYSTYATIAGSAVNVLSILFLILAPVNESGSVLAAMAIGIGSLTTASVSVFFVSKFIPLKSAVVSKEYITSLFYKSIPLALTLLFNLIYFRLDTVILTLHRTTAEVGVYGFIYKIFEVALVFPTFFMNSVYPLLLASYKANAFRSREDLRLVIRSCMLLSGTSLLVCGLFFTGSQYLPVIHPEFTAGIFPLNVLASSLPFFYLSSLTMWLLITFEKQKLLMLIYGFSMIINLVLNLIFIPQYGMNAAALITLISECFVLILSAFFAIRYLFQKIQLRDIKSFIKKR